MAACRSLMAMAIRGCSIFSLRSPFAAKDGDSGRTRSSKAVRATSASLRGKLKRMGVSFGFMDSWQISAAEDGTNQLPISCGRRPQKWVEHGPQGLLPPVHPLPPEPPLDAEVAAGDVVVEGRGDLDDLLFLDVDGEG